MQWLKCLFGFHQWAEIYMREDERGPSLTLVIKCEHCRKMKDV